MTTAEISPDKKYWSDRAGRAIAANITQTNAIIHAELHRLSIVRSRIPLSASWLHERDTDGWQRVGVRLAEYHRASGRVHKAFRRLGRRLDRVVYETQL
jgi:hypothetical protein